MFIRMGVFQSLRFGRKRSTPKAGGDDKEERASKDGGRDKEGGETPTMTAFTTPGVDTPPDSPSLQPVPMPVPASGGRWLIERVSDPTCVRIKLEVTLINVSSISSTTR